ncbi:MAG: maleylacetoacetate isomerase [Oligoflexales bacterium]
MSKLTLHHYYRSTCSWRVRWALHYKGIPFDTVAVNLLKGEQNQQQYMNFNPMSYVPSLSVDGETFSESVAILEWLEEVHPKPSLLPQDPLSRMRVRQLYQLIASSTQPLQNLAAQKYFSPEKSQQWKYARHWINKGFSAYETLLQTTKGSFSFGESLTLADICLLPQCFNALRFGLEIENYPLIHEVYKRCLSLEHYQKSVPEKYQ